MEPKYFELDSSKRPSFLSFEKGESQDIRESEAYKTALETAPTAPVAQVSCIWNNDPKTIAVVFLVNKGGAGYELPEDVNEIAWQDNSPAAHCPLTPLGMESELSPVHIPTKERQSKLEMVGKDAPEEAEKAFEALKAGEVTK